jgi:hypothetical protein
MSEAKMELKRKQSGTHIAESLALFLVIFCLMLLGSLLMKWIFVGI